MRTANRACPAPSMNGANLKDASFFGSDVRALDLLAAEIDGLDMSESKTCIFVEGW